MQCETDISLLGSFLDGEVSSNKATILQHHIQKCPQCTAQLAGLIYLQRGLRMARSHFAPSAAFRQRVCEQIEPSAPSRWRRTFYPLAAAVVLMIVMLVGWKWSVQRSNHSKAFTEVADLHVNALASTNSVDVVSTDRHTVKPWFQGKIPFSFNLPDLTGSDYVLIGGRLVYFHQNPGAQLIVSLRQHRISILIFQENREMGKAFPSTTGVQSRSTFGTETWQSQQLRFVLISDADSDSIDRLAQFFKNANP
jgi:anti-sigma factor RsiW